LENQGEFGFAHISLSCILQSFQVSHLILLSGSAGVLACTNSFAAQLASLSQKPGLFVSKRQETWHQYAAGKKSSNCSTGPVNSGKCNGMKMHEKLAMDK